MPVELYGHQEKFLEEIRDRLRAGDKRVLAQAPTGMGKTVTASKMLESAESRRVRALFVVHGRQLVLQPSRMLQKYRIPHGVVMAGIPPKSWARVQVCSIDTLHSWHKNGKELPPADFIIADEAHETITQKWQTVFDQYPDAIVVGLTATPARADGAGLGRYYHSMVRGPTVPWLVANGYLVDARYFAPSIPDLARVGLNQFGEYKEDELDAFMSQKRLVGDVVEHWFRLAEGRPTIVFAAGLAHSRHLEDAFNAAGVSAFHIDNQTDQETRDSAISAIERGELQVLLNYRVFNRGFDCPTISACILASPTRHPVTYLQMVGRVLRTAPGKDDCLVIDHSGNVLRHGFASDHFPWTLSDEGDVKVSNAKRRQRELGREIVCARCSAVFSGVPICPRCGAKQPQARRTEPLEHIEGELVEMSKGKRRQKPKEEWDDDRKAWFYAQVRYWVNEKGWKEGAAAHHYKDKFKAWPPRGAADRPAFAPTPATLAWLTGNVKRRAIARKKASEKT